MNIAQYRILRLCASWKIIETMQAGGDPADRGSGKHFVFMPECDCYQTTLCLGYCTMGSTINSFTVCTIGQFFRVLTMQDSKRLSDSSA